MAGTARFALFHIPHFETFPGYTCCNEFIVAINAVVSPREMHLVAEQDTAGIGRQLIFYCPRHIMALVATAGYGKCRTRIVARAAGFPFFHIGHGVAFIPCARNEYLEVAVVTAVDAGVEFVAENGARLLELDFLDRMALGAILFYRKS